MDSDELRPIPDSRGAGQGGSTTENGVRSCDPTREHRPRQPTNIGTNEKARFDPLRMPVESTDEHPKHISHNSGSKPARNPHLKAQTTDGGVRNAPTRTPGSIRNNSLAISPLLVSERSSPLDIPENQTDDTLHEEEYEDCVEMQSPRSIVSELTDTVDSDNTMTYAPGK